jgi:chromosomal replication initiation ATPase DnaA
MSAPPRQLAFDLPVRAALGAEDFMASRANADALALIDLWPAWPHWAAVVVGPAQSGKSHLAHVWRFRSNAIVSTARDMHNGLAVAFREAKALVVEELEQGCNDEQMLFHLLNIAREHKLSILLTSRIAPGDLAVTFPDLRSRLRALPVVHITAPDDALLETVLVKHFADRQLSVEPATVSYIVRNMERSFSAAAAVVDAIDRRSLEAKRRVTKLLAKTVMIELGGSPDQD